MRPSISLLVASSGLANASWVKLPGHRDLVGRGSLPRETGRLNPDENKGWTPKPTPAPGSVSEPDAVLELLREKRAGESTNSWENDVTCGWTASTSSAPFTCGAGYSCQTNDENVIACVSGTFSPFFTVCLDMQAFNQGLCASAGPQTGCCASSGFGACGTWVWTGMPARSMYRCIAQPTIISMLDEPQEVIDASTSTSSTSTTSTSSTSTSSTPAQTTDSDDSGNKSSTNTGAIVGGTVAGVAILAILAGLVAWLLLRRKRAGKNTTTNQTYNSVPTDPANPQMAHPAQQQQYTGGYTALAPGGSSTFPPSSPYPAATTATAYDPRQSAAYYDKSPGLVSQASSGYASPPPHHPHAFAGGSPPVPVAGAYNPHHSVVSELESAAASGTHGNPVEIGDK